MYEKWLSQWISAIASRTIFLSGMSFRNWRSRSLFYFTFFPPIASAGFPARELAVAETFGFSCFGFLASLLPRLLLPFDIVCPSKVQRSNAEMARSGCGTHRSLIELRRWIAFWLHVGWGSFSVASSNARCWPRDTVVMCDRNIAFAAAKPSEVSIFVQFSPAISNA